MEPEAVRGARVARTINKTMRIRVWDEYGGKGLREMVCFGGCNRIIDIMDFECGHVVAHAMGGTITLDNLRPICGTCNRAMGTRNMIDFLVEHGLNNLVAAVEVGEGEDEGEREEEVNRFVLNDEEMAIINNIHMNVYSLNESTNNKSRARRIINRMKAFRGRRPYLEPVNTNTAIIMRDYYQHNLFDLLVNHNIKPDNYL